MYRPLALTAAAALAVLTAAPALSQRGGMDVAGARAAFAGLSAGLAFVENRGQWPDEVLFRARLGGGDVWVTADAVVFDFYEVARETRGTDAPRHGELEAMRRRGHVVAMRFEGGHARRATGQRRQTAYHNYFLGDDPAKWASRVPLYDEVVLEGLYDGVDLRLYEDEGRLRYDLVVAPDADASRVRMRFDGVDGVALTPEGALAMGTALGSVEHRGLLAYHQGAGGRREAVASAFVVGDDGAVAFDVRGADPDRRLVIDPLIWATFLGAESGDSAYGVAVGADGSVTVGGDTRSANFPTTAGAYDESYNGGFSDAFVARLSPDGSALLYATYLGGSQYERASAVALGADGSATVVGTTEGWGFPTTPGAFDTTHNGGPQGNVFDAFVTRLSPDGSALLYSTFLGGTGDDRGYAVAIGGDGSATVVGRARSADFPTTPGAFDTSYNGSGGFGGDAFVTRLSPDGSALLYSTFLGGSADFTDEAYGVAVGTDGSATVAGTTPSPDFPTTPGAFDTTFNGSSDAFVTRLSPDGSALLYSTFLGGGDIDEAYGVAVGADGSATVAGTTPSPDFPTTPGAFDTSHNGSSDAFVARLSPNGSALLYSTFLGGSGIDEAYAVAVYADGSAAAVGRASGNFPVTPGAFDPSHNGGYGGDAFVTRLSPDGAALLYSTFLGGGGGEDARGVAVGADGSATVAGITGSSNFPRTPGAFDPTYNGAGDVFVARLDLTDPGCPLSFNDAAITPLTVDPGATLTVTVDVANEGSGPRNVRLYLTYARTGGGPSGTLQLGQGRLPVAPGVTATLHLGVPENALAGTYALSLDLVDTVSGTVCDTRPFTLTVQAVRGALAAGPPVEGVAGSGDLFASSSSAEGTATAAAVVAPNPASDRAAVALTLDAPAEVRLVLYDVLGREVAVVDAGRLDAGPHRLALDVAALPAGVYVWRLQAGARTEAGRLTVRR